MRTIIWFIYFWLYQLFSLPVYFKVKSMYNKGQVKEVEEKVNLIAKTWALKLVNLTGSNVEVIGQENIPKDVAVVFVANHQSNFDIPLLLGFIDKPKGFVAKEETKNMPVLGNWMKYLNCVFMNRTDIRKALKSIKEGVEIVKAGKSLVIFPEGTRSLTGEVEEFKQGSFKLALKSKAPIIPVTIDGSFDIMRKGSMWIKPASVRIVIAPPVDTSEIKATDSYLVRDEVFDTIKSNFNK